MFLNAFMVSLGPKAWYYSLNVLPKALGRLHITQKLPNDIDLLNNRLMIVGIMLLVEETFLDLYG